MGLRVKGGKEREGGREREANKHRQWLRERGGACSLPEVGLACDVPLTAARGRVPDSGGIARQQRLSQVCRGAVPARGNLEFTSSQNISLTGLPHKQETASG